MTELEQLRLRRELVVVAAQLQRATVTRRIEAIRANRARTFLGFAATAARRPALVSLGAGALRLAVRAWRRRSDRLKLKHP